MTSQTSNAAEPYQLAYFDPETPLGFHHIRPPNLDDEPVPVAPVEFMQDPERDPRVLDGDDSDDDGEERLFTDWGELPEHCRAPARSTIAAQPEPAVDAPAEPDSDPSAAPALVPDLGLPAAPCTATNAPAGAGMDGIAPHHGRDIPLSPEWSVNRKFIEALQLPFTPSDKEQVVACVNCIASNLARAAEADPEAWVSISRSETWWGQVKAAGVWPKWVGYSWMRRALSLLHEAGYIQEDRAVQDVDNKTVWTDADGVEHVGRQSRYRAYPALVESFASVTKYHRDRETGPSIRVKDKHGNHVEIRETQQVERMAGQVDRYNRFMARHTVHLPAQDAMCAHPELVIRTPRPDSLVIENTAKIAKNGRPSVQFLCPGPTVVIYRSFNRGSVSYGGRAVCWPQALSSDLRQQLLIDGEAVCELDFGAMHPTMLYAMKGLQLQGEAYDLQEHAIPGVSEKDVKIAMLIGVNAKGGRRGTVAALMKRSTLTEKPWLHDEEITGAVYDALLARHAPIADAFGSDKGIKLMRIDSDMMMAILTRCTKAGLPAFPVHDSVVCRVSDRAAVRAIMASEWDRRFNGISIGISCTSSKNPLQTPSVLSSPAAPAALPADFLDPLGADNLDLPDSLDRLRETSCGDVVETLEGRGVGRSRVSYEEASSVSPRASGVVSLIANLKVISGGLDRVDRDEELSQSSPAVGLRVKLGVAADLRVSLSSRKPRHGKARPGRRPASKKTSSAASLGRQAKARQVAEPAPVKRVAMPASVPLFGNLLASSRPEVLVKASRLAAPPKGAMPTPQASETLTVAHRIVPASEILQASRRLRAEREARLAAERAERQARIDAARLANPLFRETA